MALDLQAIKDALASLKRKDGRPLEGNDFAEAMDEFADKIPAWLAEMVAEIERLRAGLDELTDGQCHSGYGNGCDGGCQRCFHRIPVPAGANQVSTEHACIGYREHQQAGPIPRTMAEVEQENRELRQLLVTAWRSLQSRGGYLIQQGQGCEGEAAMLARELQRLGVPLDVNALTME